jgi:hypothetical protein
MSRFNTSNHRAKPPVATVTSTLGTSSKKGPDARTFEGGLGWKKDAKTDLFLRASASFHDGSNRFYESGNTRDETLRQLAQQVAVDDFTWFAQFVKWLRRTANIRTAALMIAADGVKARLDAGAKGCVGADVPHPDADGFVPTNRTVIDSALYRADEPGEMLAYWLATYGRRIPKPVKRGIADAAVRLYNQRSLLKYDTASHSVRFADVLELCHPNCDPGALWQGPLFKHAIDRRHNRANGIPDELGLLRRNALMRSEAEPNDWLNSEVLRQAGMTWEDTLSAVGSKVDKAKLWEAMIPSMGYMALLRNLRNFDESGVSNDLANQVIAKLADAEEVAKSRQLPFRFYSAYKNAPSLRWGHALETALDLCLVNVPELSGRTLILTDTSGSMGAMMSEKSSIMCLEAAGLFACALAQRNAGNVDLYQYADYPAEMIVPKGGSVLRMVDAVRKHANRVGYGTNIEGSVRQTYRNHDRVIIFSDGQGTRGYSAQGVGGAVPADVPVYLFNIQGYSSSPMPTGSAARFDLGGLSDQTFKLIPILEAGRGGSWPWESTDSQ